MHINLTLGQFITKRREELGYKKMQFAKMINVGDDSLRSWENDRFIPAGINRRTLIELLNFTPEEVSYYFTGV